MARRKRKGRPVHGILILDKPLNLSSNHALQRVKRIFDAKKAGHTGSLDPLATGVLPVCLGHATKVSQYLLDAEKSYRFDMTLGIITTTGDSEGEVLERRGVPVYPDQAIETCIDQFCGSIQQIPPMYSALKHQGQPLYKLARAGKEVERKSRSVTIHELVLLNRTDNILSMKVRCSKGTYVRTLAQDIGQALGCGAHVSMLRRTQAGPFDLNQAITLERLEKLSEQGQAELDDCMLPIDSALLYLPECKFTEEQTHHLMFGRSVEVVGGSETSLMRLYNHKGELFGLGKLDGDSCVYPTRIFDPEQ